MAAEKPTSWTETKHGGVLTALPILLAKDVFFCCCGHTVRVYSLSTGDLLRSVMTIIIKINLLCFI